MTQAHSGDACGPGSRASVEPPSGVSPVPASIHIAEQVADQCRVVAHLAMSIAALHTDLAVSFASGHHASILEINGARTAAFMEMLGDALNGMDAADDCEWMEPIFAEAQRRWPPR